MEQMLVCKGLSKRYKGGAYALRNVSFNVPTKGVFALIEEDEVEGAVIHINSQPACIWS